MKIVIEVLLTVVLIGGAAFVSAGQSVLGGIWMDMDPDFQITDVTADEAFDAAEYYTYVDPPPDIAAAVAAGARPIYPPRAFPSDEVKIAWITDLTGSGFIITSAFKELEPLVVYSTESEFPWTVDSQNSLREVLLMDLALRLLARFFGEGGCEIDWHLQQWNDTVGGILGASYASIAHALRPGPVYEGPEPIIEFDNSWHQEYPCNAGCSEPLIGCVPLAMAQIIQHYQYPDHNAAPNLVKRQQYAGMASCANWYVQQLCCTAQAELTKRSHGSGASMQNAADSLSDDWLYTSPEPIVRQMEQITADYYALLRGDLLKGRPAILRLKGICETTFQTTAHAVVCDGYKVQQEHGAELTRAFHLRMGNKGGGVNVWYSLPTDCFPPAYHALIDGVLQIAPPSSHFGSCDLTLKLNETDNQYDLLQWVQVKADAKSSAASNLYSFSSLLPGLWTSVSWNIAAGDDQRFPFPWPTLNPGIETVVLWADMGSCTRVLARTYSIGPDPYPDLLDDLELTGWYSASSKTATISYEVTTPNCTVNSVNAYLVSPQQALQDIGTGRGRSGSFPTISLQETGTGEHVVVVVASTSVGALSQTFKFVVY